MDPEKTAKAKISVAQLVERQKRTQGKGIRVEETPDGHYGVTNMVTGLDGVNTMLMLSPELGLLQVTPMRGQVREDLYAEYFEDPSRSPRSVVEAVVVKTRRGDISPALEESGSSMSIMEDNTLRGGMVNVKVLDMTDESDVNVMQHIVRTSDAIADERADRLAHNSTDAFAF